MVDTVILPDRLSVGFSGGPTFSTDKLRLKGGGERRQANRNDPVRFYTFSAEDQTADVVVALRDFFVDRRGDFYAFLMKDWMDFAVTGGALGLGDGVLVAFQCVQVVGTIHPYTRVIRHLKDGTLNIYNNDVLQVLTTDYTVSASGLVTFTSAPAVDDVISADFEFYVPVRFEGDTFTEKLPYRALAARSVADLSVIEVLGA